MEKRVGAVGVEEGWGEALPREHCPGLLLDTSSFGKPCLQPAAVFFPSFPAEGNNLSPEQIKSDLHEI